MEEAESKNGGAGVRVKSALAHVRAAIGALGTSRVETNAPGTQGDFLLCESRIDDLQQVARAIQDLQIKLSRAVLAVDRDLAMLTDLRELIRACDEWATVLRRKFGALLDDVDDDLSRQLDALERIPDLTSNDARALRRARRLLDEGLDEEESA